MLKLCGCSVGSPQLQQIKYTENLKINQAINKNDAIFSHHQTMSQEGLEPSTHGLEDRCSIQLSHCDKSLTTLIIQ